jgi:hypothetical protein
MHANLYNLVRFASYVLSSGQQQKCRKYLYSHPTPDHNVEISTASQPIYRRSVAVHWFLPEGGDSQFLLNTVN